tara:strand:- start:127 stop:369 length:243 start_codon:yes stop_codon:yes gene_type:complete
VKIAAIAYAVLWGHFLAYFLIAPVYFILAFGAIFFQILPQAIYVRLTGRRIVWLERIQPFSRETKLSADEMKERRLTERD